MKIIQSFWSGKKDMVANSFGWCSSQHHLMSWAFSCLQLKQLYNDIELYTDTNGYNILIKKMNLPYTKVHVVLDQLNHYPSELWALGKIKAYADQNEPFIHVDGDVFIWKQFEYRIHSSGLVAQNLEKATEYYTAKFIDVQKNLTYVPPEVEFNLCDKKACSCNAGIIGGTDFTFFKNYASEVFDFINKNDLKQIPAHTLINFNILFEQVLFYNRLQNEKKEVVCLFDKIFDDNGYKYEEIADFTTVPFVTTYLHLIGPHKRNKTACDLMSRTLLKHYPDYYFSIAALFEKDQNEKGLSSVTEKHVCKEAGYSFVETVHQKLTSYSFQQPDISICLSEEKLAFIINAAEQYNMALTKIKEAFQTIPSQILINRDAHSINNFSFFYQIKERQIKTVLQKKFNLTITDTIYDWTLFKKEDSDVSGIADVTEESMVRIACLPDFLFPGYQEIPLEELDYYILCLAEIPNTLETILKELEVCFNPEDIVNNYDNFFQLIMLKIRHLIVNKCLLIANSSSGFQPV